MSLRGRRHGGDPNAGKLIFTTTCGPDDQFSSPKQIRWSAALGKLLVANNTVISERFYDLAHSSKYNIALTLGAVDSDSSGVYIGLSGAIRKYSIAFTYLAAYTIVASLRMIDASGDPDYIYVTSNNATDGHGVRKVRKSDMTVVASLLATGSGDGQFNNPLGVKYYGGYVYVVDYSNSRIVKLNASDLSFVSNVLTRSQNQDIDTDGTYWYTNSTSYLRRWNFAFGDLLQVGCVSYSLTIIPDQSDGNGATLAITDSTNSHIARYKCSDLTQVGSDVGSSGDGSASLFDPVITGPAGTWYMDDGSTFEVASAANISWNGFSGYTFKTAGPHRAIFKPAAGGLAAVTAFDAVSDKLASIKNIRKCINCQTITLSENSSLVIDLNDLCNAKVLYAAYCSLLRGKLATLNRALTTAYLENCPLVSGSLSDLPAPSQSIRLSYDVLVTPASTAHLTAIRDLRIHSMGWSQAGVDLIITSMWTARAAYTYATGPSCNIGGTNPDPTGNIIAPVEGTDWHEDTPGHWVPLTPGAMIYDLLNDVNSEGFNVWTAITTT